MKTTLLLMLIDLLLPLAILGAWTLLAFWAIGIGAEWLLVRLHVAMQELFDEALRSEVAE